MGPLTLGSSERFYCDANTIIAIFEHNRPLSDSQSKFLLSIRDGGVFCITSELTIVECIVRPLRDGDAGLANNYLAFIDRQLSAPPLQLDRQLLMRAAALRATAKLSLADAMHVAAAESANCTIFLSADKRIRVSPSMRRIDFFELS